MTVEKEISYLTAASFCAVVAAVYDIRSRRIPNRLTGPAILFGLALHGVFEGWHGLFSSLAAGAICGGIFLVFYMAGGMGAGDVKLITAVAAIAGLPHTPYLLILTSLAGGVMAVGLAVMRGRLRETLANVGSVAAHHARGGLTPHPELNVRNERTLRLPYGLAIAAGSAITLVLQGAHR